MDQNVFAQKYKNWYSNRCHFYLGYNILFNTFDSKVMGDAISVDILKQQHTAAKIYNIYDDPLIQLIHKTGNEKNKFYFARGDIDYMIHPLTLTKNRWKGADGVIVRCMNFDRHWWYYYNRPLDIRFDKKISQVFWRGATTGKPNNIGNRFTMIKRWFNHRNMNVGFSEIVQHRDEFKIYVKGGVQPSEFLKYKYILSIHGNDKDSGLNWKLNSNSVVMMTRPQVTTWLMETTLIPNYHYILLKDDFSDLEDKLHWCNNNPIKCKIIIQNANTFMRQFNNIEAERAIEVEVVRKYFEIINDI